MEELSALMHGFATVLAPYNLVLMVVGIVLNDQREYRRSYMAYAYTGYDMHGGSGGRSPRAYGRHRREPDR